MQQILITRKELESGNITVRELLSQHSAKISSNNALALVTIGNETHALKLNDMVPTSAELLLDEDKRVIELQPMMGG